MDGWLGWVWCGGSVVKLVPCVQKVVGSNPNLVATIAT